MRTLRHDVIRLEDIYSRALFDHSEERSRLVNFYFFFFFEKRKKKKKRNIVQFSNREKLRTFMRKFSFKILVYNASNTEE